jgi:anti-anti-sigma factor
LEYISSAGLGMLLSVQKRLGESGNKLRLTQMNRHIREIFRMAGFDHIFDIE